MGSDDATASSHGFSAHSEAPPDRSGFEDIEDRYQPQHRSEISSRPSFERQKLTAEQAAANGDMQNSASLRICRTCNASFHSRNALMRHVTDRKHHERKGVQGQGAKKRRRDRREPKQRADARVPAAAMPPNSEASREPPAEAPAAPIEGVRAEPSSEHPNVWGDWDPLDNPAISHGYSSRAGYEAARRAEQLAVDRVTQSRSIRPWEELPDYSDVTSDE